jgi:hypothetical protein
MLSAGVRRTPNCFDSLAAVCLSYPGFGAGCFLIEQDAMLSPAIKISNAFIILFISFTDKIPLTAKILFFSLSGCFPEAFQINVPGKAKHRQ